MLIFTHLSLALPGGDKPKALSEAIGELSSLYNGRMRLYNRRGAQRSYVVTGRDTTKWSEPEIGSMTMRKKTTREEQSGNH